MSTLFPLQVHEAVTRRHGKTLVGPVSMTLDGRGVCVIIGPNGSGKTSFLRLLHGTARLHSGSILWSCSTEEARRRQSFVFQHPVMLRRSVLENLLYPMRIRGFRGKAAQAQAEAWAQRTGLQDTLQRPASVLSGGEQQKLAIARALVTKPDVVFLDEPCASLDGRATREIETILTEIKAQGTGLVLSTHDMGQARRLAETAVFLLRGRVHETDNAADFFNRPKTKAAQAFLNGDIVE
ncbi:MAG: ATP-binding cassette domain-containing protein [Pseudomonadota bacterium]